MLDKIKYDTAGLVTAVVQDAENGDLLMVAYMNEQALKRTLDEGIMVYWSRSRQKYWVKGESSGNVQTVKEVRIDCDGDALLFRVDQKGGACHMGYRTCFYRKWEDGDLKIVGERLFDPDQVYKK